MTSILLIGYCSQSLKARRHSATPLVASVSVVQSTRRVLTLTCFRNAVERKIPGESRTSPLGLLCSRRWAAVITACMVASDTMCPDILKYRIRCCSRELAQRNSFNCVVYLSSLAAGFCKPTSNIVVESRIQKIEMCVTAILKGAPAIIKGVVTRRRS